MSLDPSVRAVLSRMFYLMVEAELGLTGYRGVQRFDMDHWGYRPTEDSDCGTACCAAGYALIAGALPFHQPLWVKGFGDDELRLVMQRIGSKEVSDLHSLGDAYGIDAGHWDHIVDPWAYKDEDGFAVGEVTPAMVRQHILDVLHWRSETLMTLDECWPKEPVRGIVKHLDGFSRAIPQEMEAEIEQALARETINA